MKVPGSQGGGGVLVFGTTGQVAQALAGCDWSDWPSIIRLGRAEADLADTNSVAAAIAAVAPALVINAAAYTSVDRAESEPELARRINAEAPQAMARACRRVGAALIHISTDYVFDGTGRRPYREGDPIAPLGAYGMSKASGERHIREELPEHVILRTAWVYAPKGRNFINTMLKLGAERDRIPVVDDQWGCPTSARSIAQAIAAVASAIHQGRAVWGTYHYADQGPTTWCRLADSVFELAHPLLARRPVAEPITTDRHPTAAARPRYSVLDCSKFAGEFKITPPEWRDELRWTIAEIVKEGSRR